MKGKLSLDEVLLVIQKVLGSEVEELEAVQSGNIKSLYFYKYRGRDYVIRFSREDKEFKIQNYLYTVLKRRNVPVVEVINIGKYKDLYYSISPKIQGVSLNTIDSVQLQSILPELVKTLYEIHSTDINQTKGYGWLEQEGNGPYSTWREHLEKHFQKEQQGFWSNWYDLFKESFLDYHTFYALYQEMLDLSKYCEGSRYLVHGDFHFGNILTDKERVTGIIDWGNVMYGDFLFDIATIHMQFPQFQIPNLYKEHYKSQSIQVKNFDERFLCVSLCKGLDSLRFSAKLGRQASYNSILNYLISLVRGKDAESL